MDRCARGSGREPCGVREGPAGDGGARPRARCAPAAVPSAGQRARAALHRHCRQLGARRRCAVPGSHTGRRPPPAVTAAQLSDCARAAVIDAGQLANGLPSRGLNAGAAASRGRNASADSRRDSRDERGSVERGRQPPAPPSPCLLPCNSIWLQARCRRRTWRLWTSAGACTRRGPRCCSTCCSQSFPT